MRCLGLAVLFLVLLSSLSHAQEEVYVGVYLLDVSNYDILSEEFTVFFLPFPLGFVQIVDNSNTPLHILQNCLVQRRSTCCTESDLVLLSLFPYTALIVLRVKTYGLHREVHG